MLRSAVFFVAALWVLAASSQATEQPRPHLVVVDGDYEGLLSEVSEAVLLGARIAALHVNESGGAGGRLLELTAADHRSNPARAVDNFGSAEASGAVAIVSGAQSAGVLAIIEAASKARIPVVSAFPASTKITRSRISPNPAFRVSAQDADVAEFLLERAQRAGMRRFAAVIENSAWGLSNSRGIRAAVKRVAGASLVDESWFALGGGNFSEALATALAAGPEAVIVIGKSAQGVETLDVVADLPEDRRPAVLMHWGTATGRNFRMAASRTEGVNLGVFQTFNFDEAPNPALARRVVEGACALGGPCDAGAIVNPIGVAQGYDAVRLIALGLDEVAAGRAPDLLDAMQNLPAYDGMVRGYAPAFTAERREALDPRDYLLVRYTGEGLPVRTSLKR